jgi:hypothetical protein
MTEASSVDITGRMCEEFDMPDLPIVCTLRRTRSAHVEKAC